MLMYVTENVEVQGQESYKGVGEMRTHDATLRTRLDAATERNDDLEKQLGDITKLVDELQLMVGAKGSSKEGFQEAIESLKRGYSLCQKDDNTLIEARIHNGAESLQVIGDIPSDLIVNLAKGDQKIGRASCRERGEKRCESRR